MKFQESSMPVNKIFYTWEHIHFDAVRLHNLVVEVGFVPDIIACTSGASSIAATILSHLFNIPVVHICTLKDGKNEVDVRMVDKVAISATHGKKVLFIEDVVDTGITLSKIKRRMFDTRDNIMYTALWFNPNQTECCVHFCANQLDRSIDNKVIVFPYQ